MNAKTIAPASIVIPTIPGTPFRGGFYVARYQIDGVERALIVAPKAAGELSPERWSRISPRVDGALSFVDGLANTRAMAEAGSALAKAALALRIGEFDDWCIPARDQIELLYRFFKPTGQKNWCCRGDNPSSLPPRFAYMPDDPAQTVIEAFKAGGAEAFETDNGYWSSTQSAGGDGFAWYQDFDNGGQNDGRKVYELLARAVRSEPIR